MISSKKINLLLSPAEMEKVFKRKAEKIGIPSKSIRNIKIKVLKEYIDWRSYSLVVLYSINNQKKIIGVANSDGKKEYSFKANTLIFKHFSESRKKHLVPEPYCYVKSLGLFLEEYLEGENFGKILNEGKKVKDIYSKKLAKLLVLLQKAKIQKPKIKEEINFYDIEKNIKILKQRKEGGTINKIFKKLKREIRKYEKNNENKVLVHGDLNPYNLFLEKDEVKMVDFSSTHFGDRISDLANIFAHFETTPDFKAFEGKESFKDSLLKTYQDTTKEFSNLEKEKFKTYKTYFNLLNISHVIVWGDSPQKVKASKGIKELI